MPKDNYKLLFEKLIATASAALSIFLIIFLIVNFNKGFDITDEAFYILSATQPEEATFTISQFGFYTGILYNLSGQNLFIFRCLGLFILVLFGLAFAISVQKYWKSYIDPKEPYLIHILTLSTITICILSYYSRWIITPSYNWQALLGTLLVAIGLLQITSSLYKSSRVNLSTKFFAIIVGIGGTLGFLAKQPTGAMLAIATIFWLIATTPKKHILYIAAISIFTSILFLASHVIYFHGSVFKYLEKLAAGLEIGNIIVSTEFIIKTRTLASLSRIPRDLWNDILSGPAGIIFLALLLFLFASRFISIKKSLSSKIIANLFLALIVFAWIFLWLNNRWHDVPRNYFGIAALNLAILVIISSFFIIKLKDKTQLSISKNNYHFIMLIILLLILSFSPPALSGIDVRRQLSITFIFIGAICLYSSKLIKLHLKNYALEFMMPLILILSVYITILNAYHNPYRLSQPINKQSMAVSFLQNPHDFYVDKETFDYIYGIKNIAKNSNWKTNTPLIDLTGGSPGAVVILNGTAPGSHWLIGGYKNSYDYVYNTLIHVEQSVLERSWVLTADHGKRAIATDILEKLKLDFPEQYIKAGEIRTGHRDELQTLWKPTK